LLAFDDRGRMVTLEPDALRVLDAPPRCTHSSLVPLPESKMANTPFGPLLASSADGRTMAIARGAQLLLWRPAANEPPVVVKPPPSASRAAPAPRNQRPGVRPGMMWPSWRALAVSPRADRLYLLSFPGELQVWALDDAGKGSKVARRLPWGDLPNDGTSLALSPDGSRLAIGDRTGGVTLIDTVSGKTRTPLPGSPGGTVGSVSSLAFSPDGKELAVGAEQGHIDLWLLADPTAPLVRLPGHRGSVFSLAFDAEGRHLASAVSDKTVDVWDLEHLRDEFGRLGLAW
jgi:WD40 repeat protein